MESKAPLDAIDQFKAMYRRLGGPRGGGGISYHAVQDGSGWVIRHARVFLGVDQIGTPNKIVRFKNQEVGFITLSNKKLGVIRLLEDLANGSPVKLGGKRFSFPVPSPGQAYAKYQPFHERGAQGDFRFAVLTIHGDSYPIGRFSQELDWALRTNTPPYGNLDELLNEFHLGGYQGGLAYLEVLVSAVAELDLKSFVQKDMARPGVFLPIGIDGAKLQLGLNVWLRGNIVNRVVIPGSALGWSERENPRTSSKQQYGQGYLEIPPGSSVRCFVTFDGIAQHEGWIGDPTSFPNWRRTAYEWADPNCEILRDLLFEERRTRKRERDSEDFEIGVATLFWLLGFSVLHLRHPRLTDNPDSLLTTPGGRLVLIECTTGVIDKEDKIAKLLERTESLRSKLTSAGSGFVEIYPILVTAIGAAAVADADKPAKVGIHLITSEGLKDALPRTMFPTDPDVLLNEYFEVLRATQDRLKATNGS